MPNLKTLAVKLKNMSRAGEVKRFMQLLELFPNLETLYIQGYRCLVQPEDWSVNQDAAASWDDLRLAPCVHNHLERVVFQDYSGHGWQRQMAKFLHGNSRFLKTLEFHCMDHVETRPFGIRPPSPGATGGPLPRQPRIKGCLFPLLQAHAGDSPSRFLPPRVLQEKVL
nr:hypothetical protein SEVIR_5G381201v2 [Setaria viridis]